MAGARGGKVKQGGVGDDWGQGTIDPNGLDHDDAMYMAKAAYHVGLTIYQAILKGARSASARVEGDNLDPAGTWDPKSYHGPVKDIVDGYVAAHRRQGQRFVWP